MRKYRVIYRIRFPHKRIVRRSGQPGRAQTFTPNERVSHDRLFPL